MNLFRLDFVQGNTLAPNYNHVVHSLTDTASARVIQSLSISPLRLQSVSNYTREPRRLSFQCYIDDWLKNSLLNPDYEHERYISFFELKAYRDDILFFSGIIETSYLSFDHSTEVISVTCYDKIRLMAIYDDLEHYYHNVLGYTPASILGYAIMDIRSRIPINIPYSTQFSPPGVIIAPGEALTLYHIDLADMYAVPQSSANITYYMHPASLPINAIKAGFRNDTVSDRTRYVFSCRTILCASFGGGEQYRGRYRARVVEIYNGICTVVYDFDRTTDWILTIDGLFAHDEDMADFFRQQGITTLFTLEPEGTTSTMTYQSFIPPEIHDEYPPTNPDYLLADLRAYGNALPAKILPGKAYEEAAFVTTPTTKVIQAILMLYNATIIADVNGTLRLRPKETISGDAIIIDDLDITAFSESRGNQESPNTSIIDILAGDTELLQSLVSDNLIGFFGSLRSCELSLSTIDKYSLSLNSVIQIKDNTYIVYEIDTDFAKDEMKVKAWLM